MTARPPRSILFTCSMNSVRSPMAASIAEARLGPDVHVESVGVYEGAVDPFAEAVMKEVGLDISGHVSRSFEAVDAGGFDVIVALTTAAKQEADRRAPNAIIEFWDMDNPSNTRGSREQVMEAFRETRAALEKRIMERFAR